MQIAAFRSKPARDSAHLTLTIRLPTCGVVWNRPSAVLIEQGDRVARLPIIDITRLAQVALLSLSLCFTIAALIGFSGQRRAKHG